MKRPVNTKEDDVVTKASAHVREKDAIARYAAGLIRDDDAVFVDAGTTTERMTEYIANKNAVCRRDGIDLEKGFTTPDMDEALIKEEMVNRSNDVYILADSSKFEQVFAVTFTKLKGKCIITDRLDNDLYRKHAIVKEVNK